MRGDDRGAQREPEAVKFLPDKGQIELCIMGHEHAAAYEAMEVRVH
jgi:predicted phosphodiesterase